MTYGYRPHNLSAIPSPMQTHPTKKESNDMDARVPDLDIDLNKTAIAGSPDPAIVALHASPRAFSALTPQQMPVRKIARLTMMKLFISWKWVFAIKACAIASTAIIAPLLRVIRTFAVSRNQLFSVPMESMSGSRFSLGIGFGGS